MSNLSEFRVLPRQTFSEPRKKENESPYASMKKPATAPKPPISERKDSNASLVPPAMISGHLDISPGCNLGKRRLADLAASSNIAWSKQFVEVKEGKLMGRQNRTENDNTKFFIDLHKCTVSSHDKNIMAICSPSSVCFLRFNSETKLLKWVLIVSQYCQLHPIMEGYALKLSGGKNVFEERFLRLNTAGVLSWYKSDSDSDSRGSLDIQVHHLVSINKQQPTLVMIDTQDRCYQFNFPQLTEAQAWNSALRWYAHRKYKLETK